MSIASIKESVKNIAQKTIKPKVREWDKACVIPSELYERLGDMGLMGMLIPEQYGGSGLGYHEYVVALVEISKVFPSLGLSVAAHNSLCVQHIFQFGNESQKKKYLPQLTHGKSIGAWALTEPNSGSDSGAMQCVAIKNDDHWVINGNKMFITHGGSASTCVLLARTGEPNAKNNITAFIIEKGTKGFTAGKPLEKLGMNASETCELFFNDCVIPDSQRIGNEGEGFKQAMQILDGGRISIAALSLGIAKGAYETALNYAKQREQFGNKIGSFQSISFMLADMATQIHGAELMINHASDLKNNSQKVTTESAMAKLYASEIAVSISNNAVQILGGNGYMKDYSAEMFYRDSKLCTIGEGTSEIQRLVIARALI